MNLKKDALVAVSLAGAALVMAAFSSEVGRREYEESLKPMEPIRHDRELYNLYAKYAVLTGSSEQERKEMGKARRNAIKFYFSKPLKDPMDFYRLASILKSSADPKELALAHRLSLEALGAGVKQAQRTTLETQDRLLLSKGRAQRYGTQVSWKGKPLGSYGTPVDNAAAHLKQRVELPPESESVGPKLPNEG